MVDILEQYPALQALFLKIIIIFYQIAPVIYGTYSTLWALLHSVFDPGNPKISLLFSNCVYIKVKKYHENLCIRRMPPGLKYTSSFCQCIGFFWQKMINLLQKQMENHHIFFSFFPLKYPRKSCFKMPKKPKIVKLNPLKTVNFRQKRTICCIFDNLFQKIRVRFSISSFIKREEKHKNMSNFLFEISAKKEKKM